MTLFANDSHYFHPQPSLSCPNDYDTVWCGPHAAQVSLDRSGHRASIQSSVHYWRRIARSHWRSCHHSATDCPISESDRTCLWWRAWNPRTTTGATTPESWLLLLSRWWWWCQWKLRSKMDTGPLWFGECGSCISALGLLWFARLWRSDCRPEITVHLARCTAYGVHGKAIGNKWINHPVSSLNHRSSILFGWWKKHTYCLSRFFMTIWDVLWFLFTDKQAVEQHAYC